MNPFYLIPIAAILILFIVDGVVRKKAFSHVQHLYDQHRTDELLDYLNSRYARLLFPVFNRSNMQFKAFAQAGQTEKASDKLQELLNMKATDEQRSALLASAFEFYLSNDMGKEAKEMLGLIGQARGSEEAVIELTKLYDIKINHSSAYLAEMEQELPFADDATRRRLQFLIKLQKENRSAAN